MITVTVLKFKICFNAMICGKDVNGMAKSRLSPICSDSSVLLL